MITDRRGVVRSFQTSMDPLVINGVERCSNDLDEDLVLVDLRNRETGIEFKNIGSVAEIMVDPSLHMGGNRRSSHGWDGEGRRKPN